MKSAIFATCITTVLAFASPAQAQDYRAVTDRSEFLALISGRALTMRLYNLSIEVRPDGQIEGAAMGWDVSGDWSWQDGYFCRNLDWGGDDLGYNCQLVEVSGDLVRFTSDQGTGDSAQLRIR